VFDRCMRTWSVFNVAGSSTIGSFEVLLLLLRGV